MKKCPFCAEEIQDEAIKCRYCGSAIVSPVIDAWAQRWTALTDAQRREGWERFSEDERRQLTAALGAMSAPGEKAAPAVAAAVAATPISPEAAAPQVEPITPFGCATAIGALFGICLLAIVAGASDTPTGMGIVCGFFAAAAGIGGLLIKGGARREGITIAVVAGSLALVSGLLFLGRHSDYGRRVAEQAAAQTARKKAEDQRLADLRGQKDANFRAATEASRKATDGRPSGCSP